MTKRGEKLKQMEHELDELEMVMLPHVCMEVIRKQEMVVHRLFVEVLRDFGNTEFIHGGEEDSVDAK